ncbi:MAG: glutamine synthetase family protein, partial [Dehalococcoidia bacterium]|nr:glutamine synthetase family protein [Dehalococcoidia bacterium]
RILSSHFLDGCRGAGFPQCDVIFGWDIQEQLIDGLAVGSARTGFADIVMRPDLDTFRPVPWEEGAAAVVCDYTCEDGRPLPVSPRQVLRRVVERAEAAGFRPRMAVELEVRLFREDQESLRAKGYAGLQPLSPGLNCYSIHHASLDEDVVGRIRRMMIEFGVPVEGYSREHGEGMYEVNLYHADPLAAADRAMLYKSGAKEIAGLVGVVPTFMAKYDDRLDGCSGHLHQSLWSGDGSQNLFWDPDAPHHASEQMCAYGAGLLATLPELMPMYAPNVNSYKRFVPGSWAPTSLTWGFENRTVALRFVGGSPPAMRIENRVPGADVNAYLGFAASLAGGLHGIEQGLSLPPPVSGDAYAVEAPALPRTLAEALDRFGGSAVAREYFGEEFVEQYAAMRWWEVNAFRRAVTD